MEIFTNWMNNLVAKPSFHTFIKRIPIIRRLALNDGKIIYDLVAGFVYSQVLLAIIELRLIDFLIIGNLIRKKKGLINVRYISNYTTPCIPNHPKNNDIFMNLL